MYQHSSKKDFDEIISILRNQQSMKETNTQTEEQADVGKMFLITTIRNVFLENNRYKGNTDVIKDN